MMFSLSDDPYTLQREVKKAYLLRLKGILTDEEFAESVGQSIRKTTAFSDRDFEEA